MYKDLKFRVVEVSSWRCLGLSSTQAVLNFMYAVSVCLFVCVVAQQGTPSRGLIASPKALSCA